MRSLKSLGEYFLSIDMDFFELIEDYDSLTTLDDFSLNEIRQWLDLLVADATLRGIPISACMNHQQMLGAVNASSSRVLLNFDYHSDLADKDVDELNCGTWVSYVKWRRSGVYCWVRPERNVLHGECGLKYATVKSRSNSDWGKLHAWYSSSLPYPKNVIENASEIWLCSSPAYARPSVVGVFKDLVKTKAIPYKKGVKHENHKRKMTPLGINGCLL